MRRLSIPALLVALAALLLAVSAGGAAAQDDAGGPTKHCRNTHFAPFHATITQISATGAGCSAARALSLAYERAVTSSTGAVNHVGHCFGAHSYGNCTVQSQGRTYKCFHYDIVPKKTAGLVRCTADPAVIKFNVGN